MLPHESRSIFWAYLLAGPAIVLDPFEETIDETACTLCSAPRCALGHHDGHPEQWIHARISGFEISIQLCKFMGECPQNFDLARPPPTACVARIWKLRSVLASSQLRRTVKW